MSPGRDGKDRIFNPNSASVGFEISLNLRIYLSIYWIYLSIIFFVNPCGSREHNGLYPALLDAALLSAGVTAQGGELSPGDVLQHPQTSPLPSVWDA